MKNKLVTVFLVVLMFGGVGIFSYPMVSNLLREHQKDEILTEYDQVVENQTDEQLEKARLAAQEYNKGLMNTVVLTDPFDEESLENLDEEYQYLLNLDGNGMMGYVEIPRIGVYEPVYHGTSDEILKKGVGHLMHTSLPVGGTDTHAVLSGHTGLPEAEIFTRLTEVSEGDLFLVHVLKEVLAYEVDQIKVVEPENTEDLYIEPGQDYVTLVTCTPYGINSHRLLVRGKRVPYTPEVKETAGRQQKEGAGKSGWRRIYGKAAVEGAAAAFAVILIIVLIRKIRKKCRKRNP